MSVLRRTAGDGDDGTAVERPAPGAGAEALRSYPVGGALRAVAHGLFEQAERLQVLGSAAGDEPGAASRSSATSARGGGRRPSPPRRFSRRRLGVSASPSARSWRPRSGSTRASTSAAIQQR